MRGSTAELSPASPKMPIEINGEVFKSIQEAAKVLKVHQNTLRGYINKGIVSKPPVHENGLTDRWYFSDELLVQYKNSVAEYKIQRRKK